MHPMRISEKSPIRILIFQTVALLIPFSVFNTFGDERQVSGDQEPCATPDSVILERTSQPLQERRQCLARLGVDKWHKAGFRGQGIKIALLDSGFRGYKSQLGKALPEKVTVRSFRADGDLEARNSQHGILCGEVLHALAPDAELLLANWDPDRPDQFLNAVRWARKEGARLISCSLIMPSWSDGEGNGKIHETMSKILGSGSKTDDLLCFASAGNTAQRHWSGTYQDDGQDNQAWGPGQSKNLITPWGDERISVEMCWQDSADYDLRVVDVSTGLEVAISIADKTHGRVCAVARWTPQSGHLYELTVGRTRGKGSAFHLVVLGAGLKHAKALGSIAFPADGPEVVAVGAVDQDGNRAPYSSCGPNSSSPKPDFVAVVPFCSLWRDRAFSGTSAAAPQAAGLAALLLSCHPDWTANHVREVLQSSARDLGPKGHDYETGYGYAALPGLKQ